MSGEDLLDELDRELDRLMASVMPDSWHGHARLYIAGKELTDEQADFARRLSKRMLDRGSEKDAETVARVSVKKTKEKL